MKNTLLLRLDSDGQLSSSASAREFIIKVKSSFETLEEESITSNKSRDSFEEHIDETLYFVQTQKEKANFDCKSA